MVHDRSQFLYIMKIKKWKVKLGYVPIIHEIILICKANGELKEVKGSSFFLCRKPLLTGSDANLVMLF